MRELTLDRLDQSIKKYVIISVAAHIFFVSAYQLKNKIFPSQDLIIRSAIKVDMVGLPEKTKKPEKAEVAKPKPAPPEKKEKPKAVQKKPDTKAKQAESIRRLKAKSAIERLKEKMAGRSKELTKDQPKTEIKKGNIITSGDSFSGLDKFAFEEYFGKMKAHLNQNWNLPQWLADANLKAQVQVSIDERGVVVKRDILTSSGNSVFDNTILAAVDSSSPFPTPPDRLKSSLSQSAIIFNFPN